MTKRVYSLETEYALVHDTTRSPTTSSKSAEELYALIEQDLLARLLSATCDPTRATTRQERSPIIEIREGYFLANGARIYLDTGHLEWASPETSDPYQALVYDRAGALELVAAANVSTPQLGGGRLVIVKNNLDYQSGITYGCHENYSLRNRTASGHETIHQVVQRLVPFLVTRQILCGAGRLGASQVPYTGFQLSQRADFITDVSSVQTRESRPIVNLRDEPLANNREYARLHLILGDSNMAEYSTFLKLGMTGILLDMIEMDAPLPRFILVQPAEDISRVSRDLNFRYNLALTDGSSLTALAIQREYWQAARAFVMKQEDSEEWARHIIQLWDNTLTVLEQHRGQAALQLDLDWAIKRRLFGEILFSAGMTWHELDAWELILAQTWQLSLPSDPPVMGWDKWLQTKVSASTWSVVESHRRAEHLDWKQYAQIRNIVTALRVLDLRYHDIDPHHGLFYRRRATARIIPNDRIIEDARTQAPRDTRAAVRAIAIHQASVRGEQIRADWDRLYFVRAQRQVELPDPLANDVKVLERVLGKFAIPTLLSPSKPPEQDGMEIEILNVEDWSESPK